MRMLNADDDDSNPICEHYYKTNKLARADMPSRDEAANKQTKQSAPARLR
jgi:hypothetical protein